ncbi:MAG: hypothetical protein EXR58_00400 [Chloroflexi bacterium]|nr:hypothetical protein [Chloroflexota bacterium]
MPPTEETSALLECNLDELWARIQRDGPWGYVPEPDEIALVADEDWERSASQQARRRTFLAFYSYAVPDRASIAAIAAFVHERTVLEVGAGSGLWAKLLAAAGVKVIATDGKEASPSDYFPIATQEAEAAVLAHGECGVLLLCWPPFKNRLAVRALRAFRGERFIYVADTRFTADGEFHELLEQGWELKDRLPIPAWPGFEDHVYLYSRI